VGTPLLTGLTFGAVTKIDCTTAAQKPLASSLLCGYSPLPKAVNYLSVLFSAASSIASAHR